MHVGVLVYKVCVCDREENKWLLQLQILYGFLLLFLYLIDVQIKKNICCLPTTPERNETTQLNQYTALTNGNLHHNLVSSERST